MSLALEPAAAVTAAGRAIPFDYSFRFELEGVRDRTVADVITISVEGEFVAASIGHGFAPAAAALEFGLTQAPPVIPIILSTAPVALANITLADVLDSAVNALGTGAVRSPAALAENALRTGFRLNPELVERLTVNRNALIDGALQQRLFRFAADAGEIQFLYALFDLGSGREFQSQPVLSTAGLGTSTGERPFRQFAVPVEFAPRSTIRMEVTEVATTPGTLHVVLHGYKRLGESTPSPAARAVRRR